MSIILRQYTQKNQNGEIVRMVWLRKEPGSIRKNGTRRSPKFVIDILDAPRNKRVTWMIEHDDLLILLRDLVICYRDNDEQMGRLRHLILGALNGEKVVWDSERYECVPLGNER